MPRQLRKYWFIFLTTLKDAYSYRSEGFIFFLADLGAPTLMLFTWLAIYRSDSSFTSYDLGQMLFYYLCIFIFRTLLSVYPHELSMRIKSGEFSFFLQKPVNILFFHLSTEIAWKMVRLIYLVLAVIIIKLFLFSDLSLPRLSFSDILLVSGIAFLGLLTNYFLKIILETVAFWTTESDGIRIAYYAFEGLLSGSFLPLDLFPALVGTIASALPTYYFYYFPTQIILDRLSGPQLFHRLIGLFIWLAVLFFTSGFLLRRGIRRYSAVGG